MTTAAGRAVGAGALAALAVAAPAALIAQALDAVTDSGWSAVLVPVILVGFGVGGYVAAQRSADTPLVNGALAAAAAFVVVQAIGIVRRLVADQSLRWGAYVFNALLAACVGVLGAIVASRRTA